MMIGDAMTPFDPVLVFFFDVTVFDVPVFDIGNPPPYIKNK